MLYIQWISCSLVVRHLASWVFWVRDPSKTDAPCAGVPHQQLQIQQVQLTFQSSSNMDHKTEKEVSRWIFCTHTYLILCGVLWLSLVVRKWENNPSYWLEKDTWLVPFWPCLFLGKFMTNPYVIFLLIAFIPVAYLDIILFYLVDLLGSNPKFLERNPSGPSQHSFCKLTGLSHLC